MPFTDADRAEYGAQKVELLEQLIREAGLPAPTGDIGSYTFEAPDAQDGSPLLVRFRSCSVEDLQRALDKARGAHAPAPQPPVSTQPPPAPRPPQPAPAPVPPPAPLPPISAQPAPQPPPAPPPAPPPPPTAEPLPPVSTQPPPGSGRRVPPWFIPLAVVAGLLVLWMLFRSPPSEPPPAPRFEPPVTDRATPPAPERPAVSHPTHTERTPTPPPAPALSPPAPPRRPQEDEAHDMPVDQFREIQRKAGPETHPVE